MIRKDLRTAIEMNRLETFTAHSLAGLLAASNEEQAKRHRTNASTLLYELAQRGEIVCVGREGLHKVYRKAKILAPLLSPKPEPEPTTSPTERMRHLTEAEPEPTTKPTGHAIAPEPTTDPGSPSPGALTESQIGRAMINLVAQLERTISNLKSIITKMDDAKRLAAAEHHRQISHNEQALRAAQDTIKQLEHKLQQATLIRRPSGGAPLTMAIGKLLDSAGAGR